VVTWYTVFNCVTIGFPRALTVEVTNYEGRGIRSAGLIVAFALTLGALTGCIGGRPTEYLALAVAAGGFGALGFLDDRYGDRTVSGFRGHLTAALRGRFTTGFVKMAGGALIALLCAVILGTPWWFLLNDAVIIALLANALNLLDTRPARASCVAGLLCIPALPLSLFALAAALGWFPIDRQRKMMLGDAGSNALGATCGVLFLVTYQNDYVHMMALAVLMAFHVWTELFSINAFIARRPILDRVDRWIHGTPPSDTGV
jgi:UDP-N-acetylmuramyl pentapeptide phosphotransferase/UDP-N-acetylglucosamine-1-phosphate transferase